MNAVKFKLLPHTEIKKVYLLAQKSLRVMICDKN